MPNKAYYIYWDSCVFIDYLKSAPHRIQTLDDVIAETKREDGRIVTSVLSITEVSYAAQELQGRALDPDQEKIYDEFWGDTTLILLVELDEFIARQARNLMRQVLPTIPKDTKLPLTSPDAIHLATAWRLSTYDFQTYDAALHQFGKLIGRTVHDPVVRRPRLL